MTIRVTITHNEAAGSPAFVDVHHRSPGGGVVPSPQATYTLDAGTARTIAVHRGQLLVVRDSTDVVHTEEF